MKGLRVERARAGLTLHQLSARSGVNPGTISALERGVRRPQMNTIYRLANALGVDVQILFGGREGSAWR